MKYTLLELVQTVLSSMDSDEVTSIDDTVESQQVAKIIRTVYYDIVSPTDLPEHFGLFTVTESSASTPTVMTKPTDVDWMDWVKYDCRTSTDTVAQWKTIEYVKPEEFISRSHKLDLEAATTESFTATVNGYSATIYIKNDEAPSYWTSFDDSKLTFNAYDSGVETYLKTVKSLAYGKLLKTFPLTDSFIPEIDDQQFALLLNEAKALAWAELKQSAHQKAEKIARTYRTKLERNKKDLPGKDGWRESLPNYGRHR